MIHFKIAGLTWIKLCSGLGVLQIIGTSSSESELKQLLFFLTHSSSRVSGYRAQLPLVKGDTNMGSWLSGCKLVNTEQGGSCFFQDQLVQIQVISNSCLVCKVDGKCPLPRWASLKGILNGELARKFELWPW